jgi:methylenetetrahydrofolate dehydrogenase (NADP+)/methenyltetrahydrofolate cyclohydrolase
MTKILDATSITENKTQVLINKAKSLSSGGLTPCLHVIIVGENTASQLYVRNKERFCAKIGANFRLIKLAEDVNRKEFLNQVELMNNDPLVTGCFVQLPVPKQLQDIDVTQLINPAKDVDGIHALNIEHIYKNTKRGVIPCTPKGILTLLRENKIEVEGMNVVVIGRSFIVGKPMTLLFTNLNATVTQCHSKTKNLTEHTKNADIIVCALGRAHFINRTHLSEAKNQIIIDVGMNKLDGKTVGDVNFEDVKNYVAAISPVPGGVGPMTIFSLMENLLESTEKILNKSKGK